ncbi:MAG TPA: hypothetical protein ENN19_05715 [Chloroflexi bacterium]|nr:hypothetical protein [Chloroflexota bacterium]
MARYFLGVDVGSTKTHALIAEESGQVIGLGKGGPANPEAVGYEGFTQELDTTLTAALSVAGISRDEIIGAGFGIGGYDWPSQREPLLAAIDPLGLDASLEIVNDALVGLLAGAQDGWGVAVVAGTSCNCWGLDRERRVGRMTGFSWLGEAAGASELVLKALQAIALAWTKRGPETRLTEVFVKRAGLETAEEFLEALTLGHLPPDPEAAPCVFEVAVAGDPVAHDLIVWAGRELGDMAVGVIRQLNFHDLSFEVVMAGSFFNGSQILADEMRKKICTEAPGAALVRLHVPPVVGAVVLGMEQAGFKPAPVRQALIQSTDALLERNTSE